MMMVNQRDRTFMPSQCQSASHYTNTYKKETLAPPLYNHPSSQHLLELSASSAGPDYPMCAVCTCTWGPTTLETPPPGSRENCHAKVCHRGAAIMYWITTTKKSNHFYGKKMWRPQQNSAHWRDRLIGPW